MIKETRVFRIATQRDRRWAYSHAFLMLAPVLLIAILWFQFEGPAKNWLLMVLIALFPLAAGVILWADVTFRRTARLTIDPAGLRLESELPGFFGSMASWDVRWEEIWKVTLIELMGIVQIRRRGFTGPPPRVLRVADWMEEGTAPPPKPPKAREAPLYKLLDEIGLFRAFLPDAGAQAMDFDLAKHPATRIAMAAMAVLAAYWAIDGFLADEAWAEWSAKYLAPHAVVGVVVAIVAGLALESVKKPERVPLNITLVVAALMGFTGSLASWTGLIRVNQVFGGPLVQAPYLRNFSCRTLVPMDPRLPPIEYTEQAEKYWCQFPRNYRHIVPVRRGLFGLYQVDLTKHTAAIREFRAKQGR